MYKSLSQIVLLLLSLSIFGLMIFRCFRSLTAEDTGTSVKLVKNTEVPPPSFTFCRRDFSAYKSDVLKSYGMWIGKHLQLAGYKEVMEKTNKTMKDILDEAAYTQEETVDYVSVIDEQMYMEFDKQGESFNVAEFPNSEMFTKVVHPFYGNCFTLSIPMEIMANKSLIHKRYVYIQVDLIAEDYDPQYFNPDLGFNQIPEWLVFIHSNGSAFYSGEVLLIPPQTMSQYLLTPKHLKLATRAASPCISNHGYSVGECKQFCMQTLYVQRFGCLHPSLGGGGPQCGYTHFRDMQSGGDPVYDTLADIVKLADNDTVLESECGCVKPCNFINPVLVQEFSVRQPGFGKDDITKGARIFFKIPGYVEVYEEFIVYSEDSFLADFGGFLGMFLGVSLFSLHSWVDAILEFVLKIKSGRQTEKEEDNNN